MVVQEQTAKEFIEVYLEQTKDRKDRISVKDLYDQYCEFTRYSIGKYTFNRILESEGYPIMRSGGNVHTVFYIKSNWI